VDTQRFQPGSQVEARHRLGLPAEGLFLIWVGRMVPVKGLDVLLRACVQLKARGLAFRLFLVGDGPLRARLQTETRRLNLSDVVTFAGLCGHPQLSDWYRSADLTLLPSRSEGLPNVLRESVACGTPFVASRVGGIEEIADEALDRLVPPENPAALAEGIFQALAARGGGATRGYRPQSWEKSADQLVGLLQDRMRACEMSCGQITETGPMAATF
jgi:glycosyltransferase involved in cell wall biosynthesis